MCARSCRPHNTAPYAKQSVTFFDDARCLCHVRTSCLANDQSQRLTESSCSLRLFLATARHHHSHMEDESNKTQYFNAWKDENVASLKR